MCFKIVSPIATGVTATGTRDGEGLCLMCESLKMDNEVEEVLDKGMQRGKVLNRSGSNIQSA